MYDNIRTVLSIFHFSCCLHEQVGSAKTKQYLYLKLNKQNQNNWFKKKN